MKYLTKSRFKQAVECPKKLFYTGKPEYKNTKNEDVFLQSLADGGFQVGELAKLLYPEGIEVLEKANEEALKVTAELLKRDKVILFEPAISYKNLLVRVDVLVKNGNTFQLIEVKAKSIDSTKIDFETKNGVKADIRPYVQDVAFQTYVLKNAFPNAAVTSYLLMPDKSKAAIFDQMNQFFKVKRVDKKPVVVANNNPIKISVNESLLYPLNVDHLIAIVMEKGVEFPGGHGLLPQLAKQWGESYANDLPIDTPIGTHCIKCEFRAPLDAKDKSGFHECWKQANNWSDQDFEKPLSLELWNSKGKKKFFQETPPKLYLSSVTKEDVKFAEADEGLSDSERQWMQINGLPEDFKKTGHFLDEEFMVKQMSSWKFPYHFIDFETSTVAMPFHQGMRPYESVAFQFSHHILEKDGTLRHTGQFLLAKPGVFPNYQFASALQEALSSDDGSVFMWANHENTILNHICKQLETRDDAPADKENLLDFLKTLIKGGSRAMVDLRILAQKSYYHPDTRASSSIKQVLPAVLKSSPFLKDIYSQPIYGAKNGIPSLNFENFVWWSQDENGQLIDPYKKLNNESESLLLDLSSDQNAPEVVDQESDEDNLEIAEGGAAASAYGRLQYESLDSITRIELETKLFKYCELDTLAMAMIVQAWGAQVSRN
uniref:DUF2779 domain-containing protein n=1 Tax=Polynucleobacter sp. TaxID=2029855 RepID=UPI004048679F